MATELQEYNHNDSIHYMHTTTNITSAHMQIHTFID